MSKVKLSEAALAKDEAEARLMGKKVLVRKSYFGGKGVFSRHPVPKGGVLCHFCGVPISREDVAKSGAEHKINEYSFCDETMCAVPLSNDLRGPLDLPADKCGMLINEASVSAKGHFPHNAKVGCKFMFDNKWLRNGMYTWPVVAARDVERGEEILLCYGPQYGFRDGYVMPPSCEV